MAGTKVRSRDVPLSVGAAAQAVLKARGEEPRLKRIFENSHVPMVMVDGGRRYVEANRPARLAFRLSLDELRNFTIDDFTPPELTGFVEQRWARLLDTGSAAGRSQVAGRDGSRLDTVNCALANVLPGLHLIAFAPADWPEHELDASQNGGQNPSASLTRREMEVLALAAKGLDGPGLARELVVSPATISSHFRNIYAKLGVRNRAAAVAEAMRLGMID
jgi:PAS domain S-box-containing protein